MTNPVGSRFFAVDFHVHTPASGDFRDKLCSPIDLVDAAVRAGMAAIVVTDHNTAEYVDTVREAARGSGLTIFPGIEITTRGGHLLAVFDPSTTCDTLRSMLILSGIDRDRWGHEDAIGHDFEKVLDVIADKDGLAIAAHADGPKGFLTTVTQGQARIAIFKNPKLTAIELTARDKKDSFVQGKVAGYDRCMPCVQGSDAHSLVHVGSKYTWLKMHHLTLEGVRQALAEPDLRVRFVDELNTNPYPYIASLTVSQGFLAGQQMTFNPSLNCLVGGAGSGKSTVIEFLRFVLDQTSTIESIKEDAQGKLRDLAQAGATIEVVAELDSGERLLVQRTFDDAYNPITVTRMSTGEVLDNVDVAQFFPIHAYSQGEAIAIARSPLAQLELIDKHLNLHQYQLDLKAAYNQLSDQIGGIVRLEAVIKDRDTIERNKKTVAEQIRVASEELAGLTAAQKDPVVTSHRHWVAEKAFLAEVISRSFSEVLRQVNEAFDEMEMRSLQVDITLDTTPNKDLLQECADLLQEIRASRDKAQSELQATIARVEGKVKKIGQSWKQRFVKHDAEYQQRWTQQGQSRIENLNKLLERLHGDLRKHTLQLQQVEAAQKTLTATLKKRSTLLTILTDRKERIFTLRARKAKQIVSRIGATVALRVVKDGHRDDYESQLVELMRGRHAPRDMVRRLCSSVDPTKLAKLLRENNALELEQITQIGEKWVATILEQAHARPDLVYAIESVPVEDRLEISFRISSSEYREIDKLSTGQKATVIVLLSMVEGKQPIVFDQPEDALYTPFIYSEVVRTLKAEKDQRQFIFATHNPNISVAADLDLGFVLEGTSTQTAVTAVGGLDDPDTQRLMILHLEGGEDAFRVRSRKYGLSP